MRRKLISLILPTIASVVTVSAAAGTDTVWQIQSTATVENANGGGFNPGNANFATDLTATSATGNSPIVASASYNFVANDVGHWVYIKSGTDWTPGWYQIASIVVAPNTATLTASIGTAIQVSTTTGYPTPKYGTNTVAGAATAAIPSGGGTWGIDYSQSNGERFTATDLKTTTGTTVPCIVSSVTNPIGINWTGNIIHITAGTQWTQNWYEVVSVSGTNGTLDRACATAATPSGDGTYQLGGAISLGSTTTNQTDADFFNTTAIPSTGGNRFFIKGGVTYTLGQAVTVAPGAPQLPQIIEGYQTTRGDAPLGTGRPTLANGAAVFTLGANVRVYTSIFTGTATSVVSGASGNNTIVRSKFLNNGTSAGAAALLLVGTRQFIFDCELISYRGVALSHTSVSMSAIGNYIHDSDIGISNSSANNAGLYSNNIIESNITAAIKTVNTATGGLMVTGNTLYGSENTTGIGVSIATAANFINLVGNIIYGFATGVSHADAAQVAGFDDYNDYNNNDTPVTNWQRGSHNSTLAPQFVNVSQITGTAGAFAAGNDRIIDTTKNFTTLGVVAGQDCIYIMSGTGVTAGIYGVSSIATTTNPNDTLVLDIAPGTDTTADKIYQMTVGHNFSIGPNLRALGFPGAFPAGLTTGYLDMGGVEHQDSPKGAATP